MTHALNGTRWSDQFERVKRYLVRVQRHGRSHIEYEDDLWSFFVNAWALKDWVNNDEGLDKEARARVVAAAENDFALQICADLANRTKHIVLNNYSRHDAQPVRRDVAVEFGETQSPVWTHHIALRTGDTVIAQELAEDIVEVWQSLLAEFATVEQVRGRISLDPLSRVPSGRVSLASGAITLTAMSPALAQIPSVPVPRRAVCNRAQSRTSWIGGSSSSVHAAQSTTETPYIIERLFR